jgi:hypothetical protein
VVTVHTSFWLNPSTPLGIFLSEEWCAHRGARDGAEEPLAVEGFLWGRGGGGAVGGLFLVCLSSE